METVVFRLRPIRSVFIAAALITLIAGPLQAQLSDVTQPGDPIVATSKQSPGSEGVANAVDNQPSKYLNFDKLNTGFTVTPRAGLSIVQGLALISANDHPERDPASFVLSGSLDGATFTQIASGTVALFTARFQTQTILFENERPYNIYRLIFPTVADVATANSMQISEVELLGMLGPHDLTDPGDAIVATSTNSPGLESVANAIDNQATQYRNFDKLNAGFTVIPRRGATVVLGLTLTSALDGPDGDPTSYRLEGSNDGTNFVAISGGAVPPFPKRFWKQYFFFSPPTNAFTCYRLTFPTVVNPNASSMQIGEVELLSASLVEPPSCSPDSTSLVRKQPVDTPVLLGDRATFRVWLAGALQVQWYRNGAEIPGATSATYVTPPATADDDGARYRVRVQGLDCYEDSEEVLLSIFATSPTESIGLNWLGHGSASGPVEMLPGDIAGLHPQAYWNNITGSLGSLMQPLNSSNQVQATITVQWNTSGQWGVGTGDWDPTVRMLDGMCTSAATNQETAQSVTFSNVPPGNHSLVLDTVQTPREFFSMDFQALTFNADGTIAAMQQRFIRPQNADEYNAAPAFLLVTSETPATRSVGNVMRFDNLRPVDGRIQLRFFSPDRIQLNGLQLLLNPTGTAPPLFTTQPQSRTVPFGSNATFSVTAVGALPLTYQWRHNAVPLLGATNSNHTVVNAKVRDAGYYDVIVSNSAGSTRSIPAVLRVRVPTWFGSVNYQGIWASVSFATIRGFTYQVEYTDALNEPVIWTPLLPAVVGIGLPATVYDSSPAPGRRFYRVRVE
jgi:hypothetical protein